MAVLLNRSTSFNFILLCTDTVTVEDRRGFYIVSAIIYKQIEMPQLSSNLHAGAVGAAVARLIPVHVIQQ